MEYKINFVKNISKFWILQFNNIHLSGAPNSIWGTFWKMIFSVENLEKFFDEKFDSYQKFHLNENEYFYYEIEKEFVLKNISQVLEKVNFKTWEITPNAEDVFWMYRIFKVVLGFYNNFYWDSFINLSLQHWITFTKEYKNINDLLKVADFYEKTTFFQDIIIPIYKKLYQDTTQNTLFYNRVFWPEEIIHLVILSKYLKKLWNSKMVLDLSKWNEQYDFSQWKSFLLKNKNILKNIDFFVIDNDYWKSINKIIKYLNNQNTFLENVIYLNGDWNITYIPLQSDDIEGFEESNKTIFNENAIFLIDGKKSITSRLTPYECYWNNCNFCAINSQHKLSIHSKYDHLYYINRWINFIQKNNISHVSFIDEAIPPLVLLNFAKSILKLDIKITYFLRTRIEKFYTPANIKIIQKSWARFFWMWLESASDETNERIWNKWNGWLTISEKWKLVQTMDSLGISVHNYAILWFPGEEEKDYLKTYVFLKNNIINSRQYTCSPNIFRLMKWPEIFTHRENYGIKIIEKWEKSDFDLSFEFTVDGKKRNYKLLNSLVNDLHRLQFTPWLSKEVECIHYEDFWAFIDRSEIFYLMKNLYSDSPYYAYKNINSAIRNKPYNEIKNYYFELSDYISYVPDNNNFILYQWISCKTVTLVNEFKEFISQYNNIKNLEENIISYWGNQQKIIQDIHLLFDAKILKYKQN